MDGNLVRPIAISTPSLVSTVNVTRPANTTAYTALDVVAGATTANLEFTGINYAAGQHVMLMDAKLRIDLTAVPSGMQDFRLWLFHTAPTAIADNAAFDWIVADKAKLITIVDFTPIKMGGTGILWDEVTGINKVLNVASGATSIYGVLQTITGYTPASETTLSLQLLVRQL